MHLEPRDIQLPESCRPPEAELEDHFTLIDFEDLKGHHWEAPLPFTVPDDTRRFAPPGMRVVVHGEDLPFSTTAHSGSSKGWRITGDKLHVASRKDPGQVQVHHPSLVERVRSLEPAASGLSPEDFLHTTHTIGDTSRQGLLLPAPTRLTWELDLPEGGLRFTAWPALVPSPTGERSDGAELILLIDGQEVDSTWTKDEFSHWSVDLSAWAGQRVELTLASDPGSDPWYDYAFVGAPAVVQSGQPTRRVLVVGIDTLRADHLGAQGYERDTTPELDALAARSAIFERAWTPAPRTRPSFRTATTGRLPLDAVGATNLGEVMSAEGFATAGFVANVHLHPRFGFHRGYDLWDLDPSADAGEQVDRALSWLRDNHDRDVFAFVHIMDPHLFYVAPEPYGSRFVTAPDPELDQKYSRWQVLKWTGTGISDQRKAHITGAYDGEVAYTSHELGRLVQGFDALGGSSLVVVHTDHGEELWDHGGFEHNHSLYDELVRAVLWVRPPGGIDGGRRVQATAGIVDIAPTVLDYVGASQRPPTDGMSLRPFVEGSDEVDPERAVAIAHLRYGTDRWAVVYRGHKYIHTTESGQEELYDLAQDPGELHDLSATADLEPFRAALARSHGIPVAPGWRVDVSLRSSAPLEWELPARAVAAGVIDPEAIARHRANQAWGEPPSKLPEEVAEVHLDPEGTHLRIEPGSDGRGLVYVLFDEPVSVGGTLARNGEPLELQTEPSGDGSWRHAGHSVRAHLGTVLVPPPDEADRMGIQGTPAASDSELDLLQTLGYLGEDEQEDETVTP